MPNSKVVHILLVEDDEVDVRALRWAFNKLKIANPLTVANDGVEALELLKAMPRPYLIITDINMPRMNGIELLRSIREDEQLRDSIVFVLTLICRVGWNTRTGRCLALGIDVGGSIYMPNVGWNS